MKNGGDLVSVIVPAFNAERTIDETLQSVRNQTHGNLEIIVVDDGSTDKTYQRCMEHSFRDPRVKVIHQSNAGVAAARNSGIEQSQAEIVAPIDADDLWQPSKIERQLRALRSGGSDLQLVYTWNAYIDMDSNVIGWGKRPLFSGDVLFALSYGNFVGSGSSALMRKSALGTIGGYDPRLKENHAQGCEDWWLFCQIAERFHFSVVPDYLTGYRQSNTAMSRDIKQMLRSDALVRSQMLTKYPQYSLQIASGRRAYIDWMFLRELNSGNWSACFSLMRLLSDESGHLRALVSSAKGALHAGRRKFYGQPSPLRPKFLERWPATNNRCFAPTVS